MSRSRDTTQGVGALFMAMCRRIGMCNEANTSHSGLALGVLTVPWPLLESSAAGSEHQRLCRRLAETETELRQLRSLLDQARERERAARHLANHDGLTSLPNRRAFTEHLVQALVRSTVQDCDLAVMFIDLDHFKAINDTHGHRVGDQLLAVVGSRLAQAVRAADIAARLGGDEFACLLPHAPSVAHLAQVATKLVTAIAAPIQLDRLRLEVHASIGIAVRRPGQAVDAEQLMGRADRAMYEAKRRQCQYLFADQGADVGA